MQSSHIYLGAIVVLVIIIAGVYAWRKHRSNEGFSQPVMPDNPDLQRTVVALGKQLETASIQLRATEAMLASVSARKNMVIVAASWPDLARARSDAKLVAARADGLSSMFDAGSTAYVMLLATDQKTGAKTPDKIGKSYGAAFKASISLGSQVAALAALSAKTADAMLHSGGPTATAQTVVTPAMLMEADAPHATQLVGALLAQQASRLSALSMQFAQLRTYAPLFRTIDIRV